MAKKKVENKGGAPTKYREEYDEDAKELCLLGCTMEELAEYFEVNKTTIYEWIKAYKGFSNAIKVGKLSADAKVAKSLYSRAIGSKLLQQKAIKVKDSEGNEFIELIEIEIEIAPDVVAAKFWLTNRQGDKWKEKKAVDIDHTSGGEKIKSIDPITWANGKD